MLLQFVQLWILTALTCLISDLLIHPTVLCVSTGHALWLLSQVEGEAKLVSFHAGSLAGN